MRVGPLGHAVLDTQSGDIARYHGSEGMPDILILDVPDDVVAAIDAKAQRVGLSRTDYCGERCRASAARTPAR